MRFSCLSNDQLKELEKDFVEFLIVNGVEGDSWKKINIENPQQAIALVEIFSDLVWEKILTQIKFLELKTNNHWAFCKMEEDKGDMIIIRSKNQTDLNIENGDVLSFNPLEMELITASKKYNKNREEEIFELIQSGYLKCEPHFYENLLKYIHPSTS